MFLGVEIGGTKLQLGVGRGDGSQLVALERRSVDRAAGAAGILEQIREAASPLVRTWAVEAVGIGFGGPVDYARGRTIESHSVAGWDDFPLADWAADALGLPVVMGQDCALSALAEARVGAGRDARSVFYVTVGTGVGGGFAVDGDLYLGLGPAAAEIGQMRPGPVCVGADQTVEACASGPGLVAHAAAHLTRPPVTPVCQTTLAKEPPLTLRRMDSRWEVPPERLSGRILGELAADGDALAVHVLRTAHEALGWALAQVITLLAPQIVVVGGGVAMLGEELFFTPLRVSVARRVFPLMLSTYRILPAELGETVVVQGALVIAAEGRVPTYGGAPLPPLVPVATEHRARVFSPLPNLERMP